MLAVGTYLGDRYEILEAIGSGGMADVYKAKCHKLNRFVAIKVLKSEFSSDESFVSKFKAEAQSAARLINNNIVNVYDVGEENGMYYFVMELVEGITLKHYIEKKIRLTYKEAVSIAIQVSMGIEAAHNNGIIHRDIKPQNIIISKDGKVKVADFGIAKAVSSNTVTSHAMGSVHYTSPEQARGGFSDTKSDIYSIGITLFEMVTGHVPFDGETTVAVAIKHIQEEMPSPKVYVPDVPISVEGIIFKCCQKNPDRRYQNVGELIHDLKRSLAEPNMNFVVINEPASNEGTKTMSDDEKVQIRNKSAASVMTGPVYDDFLPGRNTGSMNGNSASSGQGYRENVRNTGEMRREDYYGGSQGRGQAPYDPRVDEDGDDGIFDVRSRKKQDRHNPQNYYEGEEEYEAVNPKTSRENRDGRTSGKSQGRPDNKKARRSQEEYKKKNRRRDDYYEDDIDDDVDPKMEKVITAMLIVTAIIIAIVAIAVVGNMFGAFSFGDKKEEPQKQELTIETSSSSLTVPNVVGMTVTEASDALTKAGLTANATYAESTEYDKDYIISQDIAGGESVKAGTVLNLVVSSGKVTGVAVPDVVGLSEAEAKVKLEAEGFSMQKQLQESSDVEKGNVISQNPLGATTASKGSSVTVVISSGTNSVQVEMPNLVGKVEEEAKVLLGESNLVCRTVTEENSDTVEKGRVISQSVAAGGMVDEGTSVDLVISLGKKVVNYSCTVEVGAPVNYFVGSEAIIVLMNPAGAEISRYNVTAFPYTIMETGIADIPNGIVTITYLSNDGTWETTNPTTVTFLPEA